MSENLLKVENKTRRVNVVAPCHDHDVFTYSYTQYSFSLFLIYSLLSPENKETGRKLFIATGCMFTLPILVYYVCFYSIFSKKAQPENWAGACSILVVNVIIGSYVWSAFSEEDDDEMTARMAKAPHKNKVRTD